MSRTCVTRPSASVATTISLNCSGVDSRPSVCTASSTPPGDGDDPLYHVAFTIPRNKLAAAKGWLAARTPVMTKDGRDEFGSESWDAQQVYFRDSAGNPLPFEQARRSGLSVGVPGMVATWAKAVAQYGRSSFGRDLAPAIALARRGAAGGSGDGFASGFFYGLLTGESPAHALKLGWAHGALLTTYPGDTTMATLEQVQALAEGGSARIQR